MNYTPMTKGQLIELMKDAPDDAFINIDYKGKGYTSNIEVFVELELGAANHRNMITLDAGKPSYIKE